MRVTMVKTFVTVASTRSIALAARHLAYSESTVAYHVRELEKQWRISLFVPGVRNLTLTPHGTSALALAVELLRIVDALHALAAQPVGVRPSRRPSPATAATSPHDRGRHPRQSPALTRPPVDRSA